ncbi:MAG TPA: hypothetical protein VIX73_24700, partial [Kofleriaceae bacterium]
MRQPVSRITFDRRRGFLGVHLQEGALFVDAAWNEGADIASSLLRDAIVAGGVAGSAGRELRIEAVEDGGVLRNLRVCGTSPDRTEPPRPFYCDGLPVLWLADRFIDAQPIGDAFRLDATGTSRVPGRGTWIDLLQDDVPYEIFLRAWVDTVDRLDEPFLDDPGLDASRGTFRKRVISEVRIRRADALRRRAGSNLELSVDGSYTSDLNALYRVELDGLTGVPGSPTASVLWDPDAGATVARVVDNALEGAREIMVDSTDGFDNGFVRFEGRDVGPALYRVIKAPGREGAAIQITRHRCDRAELSLAAWQPSGTVQSKPPDRFQATFLVPAPVQAGDLLRGLPAGLDIDAREAKVVAVTDFDPDRNAVTLTLQSPGAGGAGSRALSVADWIADRAAIRNTDGTFTATLVAPPAIVVGDVVTALPPSLGTPTVPWVVLAVEPQAAPPAPPAPPASPTTAAATPARPLVKVTFGPAGLAQDLAALDLAHRSPLLAAARQFDTTLTVEDHPEWEVGMRISIVAKNDAASAAREDRLIVRIERGVAAPAALRRAPSDAPARVMHVRLDQPLSYDHAAADTDVIPEHPIRVRRFIGHECRLGIDVINPPRDGAASIANFPSGLALPGGLSIHLTTEVAGGEPRIARGDGWHFAARSDGYVDTRLFAPVEDPPASEVALARLTVHAGSHELVDLRPMPAALAVEDELVRIAAAASTIAAQLGD